MTRPDKKYYPRKIFSATIQAAIIISVYFILPADVPLKAVFFGSGIIVGFLAALLRWHFSKTIDDSRNFTLFLFFSEELFLIPLIVLLFFFRVFIFPDSGDTFNLFILSISGIWTGYIFTILYKIIKYEKEHGVVSVNPVVRPDPIIGNESMIDKTVIVKTTCNPNGTIKYKGTIWNAESINGSSIEKDEKVIIRKVVGLKTMIEKT